jgi:hypothetical protein
MSFLTGIKKAFLHHREHFMTLAFFLGFIVDNLTLNRIDQLFDDLLLSMYVVLAMASLLLLYGATAGKFAEGVNLFLRRYVPMVTQYAFGGLFSGMLIFYGRSGSWMVSWPFLLIIIAGIYGNETIKDRVHRLLYNVAMLFVGLFSFIVLIVPVVIGKMGTAVFIGSGILALVIMLLFLRLLRMVVPQFIQLHLRALVFVLGLIFVTFNALYFLNVIPPIPLSLKEIGIYHSVVHFEDGSYQLTFEKGDWWQFYKRSDDIFHPQQGGDVFCFAKVFAPTKITTDIYHKWEYYDEADHAWHEYLRLSYPIQGGASGGYRGYTLIENYRPGTWRCSVETARGQVLGREVFKIDTVDPVRELSTRRE